MENPFLILQFNTLKSTEAVHFLMILCISVQRNSYMWGLASREQARSVTDWRRKRQGEMVELKALQQ